ncbi:ferritin-like domain-domain-containing protein [Naematelia encephala]|uniref:Ferritin-like domain-domain-containing protein n=1 Tax=Naematelia encephala TaxID=71784 RepID=A0A1Y2BDZ6_9TREE|nr:ferritin-like domain-domain-containing protein [Naematelia encephala]
MSGSGPNDTQVLQYALTLENLENKFYMDALSQFSADDFTAAGYPDWVRGRYTQIAGHESDHVSLLSGALGNDSVAPCNYSFPYTDVKSFISLATLIENVGVSAYSGAAQYITTPAYVTIAAVILTTEARHQSWQSSSVAMMAPWSSAYDTPLSLDMVYTIASAFITSCPSTNAALPVMAFPTLTVANASANAYVDFSFDDNSTDTKYAIFYNGLGNTAVQLDESNGATIPGNLQGVSYVVVSTASSAADVSNSNIVAGPAILDFPFPGSASNPAFTS